MNELNKENLKVILAEIRQLWEEADYILSEAGLSMAKLDNDPAAIEYKLRHDISLK